MQINTQEKSHDFLNADITDILVLILGTCLLSFFISILFLDILIAYLTFLHNGVSPNFTIFTNVTIFAIISIPAYFFLNKLFLNSRAMFKLLIYELIIVGLFIIIHLFFLTNLPPLTHTEDDWNRDFSLVTVTFFEGVLFLFFHFIFYKKIHAVPVPFKIFIFLTILILLGLHVALVGFTQNLIIQHQNAQEVNKQLLRDQKKFEDSQH
jgi:hypothetical protein